VPHTFLISQSYVKFGFAVLRIMRRVFYSILILPVSQKQVIARNAAMNDDPEAQFKINMLNLLKFEIYCCRSGLFFPAVSFLHFG